MASQPILSLTDHIIAERLLLRPAPPRSKKWVDIDTKLQEFIDAYNNQYYDSSITIINFVLIKCNYLLLNYLS